MTPHEIGALLAYIGRLDPRLVRTDEDEAGDQIDQWHELLDEVPMTAHGWDARVVARAHILDSPYAIMPVDIARRWRAYQRDRLQRHTDPTPTADPDDQAAWQAELAATRQAVASGTVEPTAHRQLVSGRTHPDLEARLKEIGSCIPPAVRAELAPYRPARAAREAAVAQGWPDPLGVRCTWCRAQPGEPCRRRRVGPDGRSRGHAIRAVPHPGRIDLASEQAGQPSTPATA
ncbi:zinc finger domain-containing protein [Streptomyces fragilis]|uniref:DNA-binding phage zinc finger domain-containing protein n=1 Tax=Streptomyces fragilis TaxID=67301 RepID=A0ABV2YC86_9ACTN|nr:hypothetical protein [Streptomyces fragilis]